MGVVLEPVVDADVLVVDPAVVAVSVVELVVEEGDGGGTTTGWHVFASTLGHLSVRVRRS